MVAVVALMAQPCLAAYSFDEGQRFADAADWPAFAAVLARQHAAASELAACRADAEDCPTHLKRVRVVLERGGSLTREQQLRLVNRFVNNRRYAHDRPRRAVATGGETRLKSHWQTLGEFLARGGDCEDFALAKYFLLREFNIPGWWWRSTGAWVSITPCWWCGKPGWTALGCSTRTTASTAASRRRSATNMR